MDANRRYLPKCDFCGRKFPLKESVCGLCFDEANYDGNSIFVFNNLVNFPIVSEEVKKQIVKAKLSNVTFTEISEFELL